MDDNILSVDAFKENHNSKIETIIDNTKLFNRLQNLQTLIKKESSLKGLCKNHK